MSATIRGRNAGAPSSAVRLPASVAPLLRRVGAIADTLGVSAYAVGGCVRDWLLGTRRTPDVDVTIEGDGIALARAVVAELGGTLEAHEPFGTATVRLAGGPVRRLDVASCRRETYARPGAYPRVSRGSLEDDLARRDFTINAIAMAITPASFGRLVDPHGGRRDVAQRRLRILHPRSFLDDPSRMLRGIRFAQRFDCRWEPDTQRALHRAIAQGALGWLNAGRLRKEFDLMLAEPDPSACFAMLARLLAGS